MYNIGEEEIKAIAGVIRSGKLFRTVKVTNA